MKKCPRRLKRGHGACAGAANASSTESSNGLKQGPVEDPPFILRFLPSRQPAPKNGCDEALTIRYGSELDWRPVQSLNLVAWPSFTAIAGGRDL